MPTFQLPTSVLDIVGTPPVQGLAPRIATVSDVSQLVPLINEAYLDSTWFKNPLYHQRISASEMEYYLSPSSQDIILVLETTDSREICATIKLVAPTANHKHSCMSLLAISPSLHKKGLAKYMFSLLCAMALYQDDKYKDLGWGDLETHVMGTQPHLVKIYSSWGFTLVDGWDDSFVGLPADFWNVEPEKRFMVALRKNLSV
ncbi:UNVERIFIED_CONTAM: hypothetical protein HDU68_003754 [Siphonaria sp. JEL0065]|nr:hypothetical protein HDU68_003754 [Siphonaria sp. JEL0065]